MNKEVTRSKGINMVFTLSWNLPVDWSFWWNMFKDSTVFGQIIHSTGGIPESGSVVAEMSINYTRRNVIIIKTFINESPN